MTTIFTTAHFEHAAPILAELDLDALMRTKARMEAGEEGVLHDLMTSLAANAKSRTFRRLAAVVGASVDELLEAETNDTRMRVLEADAAKLPFRDSVQRVFGFFSELAPMADATPDSSKSGAIPPSEPLPQGIFPSADS